MFGTLVEADTGLIRYIDLDLSERPRHILVPIGHARVREQPDGNKIRLRAAVLEDLDEIPTYDWSGRAPDRQFERELLASYGRSFYGDRYYAHPAYDHTGLYAGSHPIVRQQPSARPAPEREPDQPRLALLSSTPELELAEGEPDVIGWAVMTDADQPSARVVDLVVDVRELQVRYVLAEVIDGIGAVLLPVGFLTLARSESALLVPGLRHDQLADLPRYDEDELDRHLEETVRVALTDCMLDRRRYQLPDFRARGFPERRRTAR